LALLFDLQHVKTLEAVEQYRERPTGDKDADDDVAQGTEVIVEIADGIPQRPLERELVREQMTTATTTDTRVIVML